MAEKNLVQMDAPVTQSADSVRILLRFYNHRQEVAELPPSIGSLVR